MRGWATELLGPKIPDLEVVSVGGSGSPGEETLSAASCIPLGGLVRWTGSLQLELPLPFAGWPHGSHLFLDGGRVWTPDRRLLPTKEPLIPDQEDPIRRWHLHLSIGRIR